MAHVPLTSDADEQLREAKVAPTGGKPLRVRTLFISDVHLGTRGCQAALLIDFLRRHEARTIFLVGDIVEGWCLKHRRLGSPRHESIVVELMLKARNGTRVVYVPGNHDQLLRRFVGSRFDGIEIALNAVHESADGHRYLVTHGDQFDLVLRHMPWLARLGHVAYHALLALNTSLNMVRRSLGLGYWSLCAWAKRKIKGVVSYVSHFEESLCAEARRLGAHGVVCGHIHHAADRDLSGIHYLNAGDWVESCTGIVEHEDGRFEVVRWAESTQKAASAVAAASRVAQARPLDARPIDAGGFLPRS